MGAKRREPARAAVNSTSTFSFSPQRGSEQLARCLFWGLLAIEASFVFFDATINYGQLTQYNQFRRMFNIAREDSLSSWFAVTQCLFVAIVFSALSIRAHLIGGPFFRRFSWGVIALFFLFMAADDAVAIHERIGSAFKKYAQNQHRASPRSVSATLLESFPSYPWQMVVGPFFAAMGVYILLFLWREYGKRPLRVSLVAGLALYAIAIALDFIEGLNGGHSALERALSLDSYTVRHFAKSLEEFLEMLGTTFLLISALRHLLGQIAQFTIQFEPET